MSSPQPGGPRVSAVSETSAVERSTWNRQDNLLHSLAAKSSENELQQQLQQRQESEKSHQSTDVEPKRHSPDSGDQAKEDLEHTRSEQVDSVAPENTVPPCNSNSMHQEEHSAPDKQDNQQESVLFKPTVFEFQNHSVAASIDNQQHGQTQAMDIHDTGSLLHQFATENDVGSVPPGVVQSVAPGQGSSPLAPHAISHGVSQGITHGVQQQISHQVSSAGGPTSMHQAVTSHAVNEPSGANQRSHHEGTTKPGVATPKTEHIPQPGDAVKKSTRMPGTKQCPSCHGTIAAAVAKCPRCEHVFRAKKEKQKRSGKRGKKNCPKCGYENPSACSSCKGCKHVFRLKLQDRYRQIRSGARTAAVAPGTHIVHAAPTLNVQPQPPLVGQQAVAPSSVPMQPGVTTYHAPIAQPMHPVHSAIPPLSQHTMGMHHVSTHNVHPPAVQQMHPMPQHPMHQHPTHPQL